MHKSAAMLAAALVGFGATAWAQTPGVMDADGSFHPTISPPVAAGTVKVVGTLTLTLVIDVVSKFADSTPIQCTLGANEIGGTGYYESDTVTAPAPTGKPPTAICKLTIPYEWYVPSTGAEISLSYTIKALDMTMNGRTSTNAFAYIGLPKDGATTHFEVSARI